MFQIDYKNRRPIYEQIIDNFKRMITSGVLKPDEKVPSIRELAQILTCNPNTIQKAYRELESQGYFYTVSGQGSFIATPQEDVASKKIENLYNELKKMVLELEFWGEKRDDVKEFILKL